MNATVESNNTPLTSEELQLLEAYRAADFNKVVKIVGTGINKVEAQREKEKAEHALEIETVKLVQALDEIIDNFAYNLAGARGAKGRWAEEIAANDLIHGLAEFLIQADIDDGYETDTMAHRHHLADKFFAYDFFGVTEFADGELTPVE